MTSILTFSNEPNLKSSITQIPQQSDEGILVNISRQSLEFHNDDYRATDLKKASGKNGRFRISTITIVLLLLLSLFIPSITGNKNGLDGGLGTNIADNGCSCHGFQTEDVVPSLTMVNNEAIVEGNTYALEISFTGGPDATGENTGGFLVNADSGSFSASNANVLVNNDEATHSTEGNDQRSWQIEWTAGSSDVTEFTLRTNSVNGDNSATDDDDWNMAIYYLKDDGTFTQTLVEPEARFIAPEWTQNLILVSSGLLMLLLSAIGLSSKSKGRRRDFD